MLKDQKFTSYLSTYNRFVAFTLAEVLIVLLIIGVIASLVIPSLINNTNEAEMVTAWRKTFAEFSQLAQLVKIDNNGSITKYSNAMEATNSFLAHLNYVKLCSGVTGECWHNTFYNLDGTPDSTRANWTSVSTYTAILNNGTLVFFYWDPTYTCTTTTPCEGIEFDINGFKKPNTVGKDIFRTHVYSNKLGAFGDGSQCSTGNQWECSSYLLVNPKR